MIQVSIAHVKPTSLALSLLLYLEIHLFTTVLKISQRVASIASGARGSARVRKVFLSPLVLSMASLYNNLGYECLHRIPYIISLPGHYQLCHSCMLFEMYKLQAPPI